MSRKIRSRRPAGRRVIFEATPQAKIRARELRKNATYTEILFWNQAKGGQILGCDFHRQKPIGRFIVDFFAPDLLLAIEIDGPIHNDSREQDAERQAYLESLGITLLRFTNDDILYDIASVITTITTWIRAHTQ